MVAAGVDARLHAGLPDPALELVDELVRREDPQRRGSELDRQRDPVEPAADLGREGGVGRGGLDLGAADRGPREEQGDRRVAHELVRVGLRVGRHGQRVDPHDALARHADREPARGEDRQTGRAGEQVGERGRRRAHVLHGVEDEQAGRASERLREGLDQGPARLVGHAHRAGDGRHHERGVADAVERHERDPPVATHHAPAG